MLVDAGNSPAAARRIRAEIEAAGLPAPRRLVCTHHHWNHVWGACAWPDVEVIEHRTGARILQAEARRPWGHRYLREEVAADLRSGQASGPGPGRWSPGTVSPSCRRAPSSTTR
ncbi:MBL fold metallo-hydrolase [Micromonospora sp. WMMD558]|uniref:MBL fold metallo-hydrolase n=1 Tax=unclassified Micromonospora TaxID=2617518 RepID=UPI00351A3FD1